MLEEGISSKALTNITFRRTYSAVLHIEAYEFSGIADWNCGYQALSPCKFDK